MGLFRCLGSHPSRVEAASSSTRSWRGPWVVSRGLALFSSAQTLENSGLVTMMKRASPRISITEVSDFPQLMQMFGKCCKEEEQSNITFAVSELFLSLTEPSNYLLSLINAQKRCTHNRVVDTV